MATDKDYLKQQAKIIRDEYRTGANTANRVGSLLVAICEALSLTPDELEKLFLRKDKDDTAKGVITFEKQIKSKDFVQGDLMGAGWSVYRDQNGNTVVETDKMVVRQSLIANELIVNQETFEKGSSIYVKGGCTITNVEEYETYYRCFYDNESGKRYSGFKKDDQARCQRYDSSYSQVIKYYWRLVVEVGENYVDLSKVDFDGHGVPEVGDDIAQLGNRSDASRQSAIVVSPDNGGSVVIWAGINSFNLSQKNMVGMGVNPNTGRSYLYGYGDMYFGDRNLKNNFITFQIKDGDTEPTLTIAADVKLGSKSEGLSNLSEFKDVQTQVDDIEKGMKNILVDFDIIKSQSDREFTIWYFAPEPTLENEPAVNWTSDKLKSEHDQDLYFSDELARAWRFVDGNWVEITDERTLAVLKFAEEANRAAQEAKEASAEVKNYVVSVLPTELDNLQKQIDGVIDSYFEKYEPTLENEPAVNWATDEEKEAHLNDTFTNLSNGRSWRWSKDGESYLWIEIADTATVEALRKAGEAQDTADKKRRVFVDTPYTPYEIGDLWVQGESGDIMRCAISKTKEQSYEEADWVKASKYTDDTALQTFIDGDYKEQIKAIEKQIDGRAETWYQETDPSLDWTTDEMKQIHVGDLWYDINRNQSFMWSGTEWINQGVPDEVFDKIDGKAQIFVSQPTSYNAKDLWVLSEDTTLDKDYKAGMIVVATQSSNTFNPSHWTKMDCYTDDTEADKANKRLDNWASDGVIYPLEKTALVQQKYDIQCEYTELICSASRYEVDYTSYNKAYSRAIDALNKYTAVTTENIAIDDDYDNIGDYYSARQALKDAIDTAMKKEMDDAYTAAKNADDKTSDLDYLKETFSPDENILEGGVVMSKLVGVVNGDRQVEAFLNGSNFAEDEVNGKLLIAGGIPGVSSDGSTDLRKRASEASFQIFESGAGRIGNGSVRWSKNGQMYRTAPEHIVWLRVAEDLVMNQELDLSKGGYWDLENFGGVAHYKIPFNLKEDVIVVIKCSGLSRSSFCAVIEGPFYLRKHSSNEYSTVDAISLNDEDVPFELNYSRYNNRWTWQGNYTLIDGIAYLEKASSSTPSVTTEGYTGRFFIYGRYGNYYLDYVNGLLKGYEYEDIEMGN